MAQVVFGCATSRSPLLSGSAEVWGWMGERDQHSQRLRDGSGTLVSYETLLARVPARLAAAFGFASKLVRSATGLPLSASHDLRIPYCGRKFRLHQQAGEVSWSPTRN